MTTSRFRRSVAFVAFAVAAGAFAAACATLSAVVQPPRFAAAGDRPAELRLLPPSSQRPLGGAAVRIWTRVDNPNGFGLNITRLAGDFFLENTRAAEVSLPLGLPLAAGQDTVIPLDVSFSFSDLPELAGVARRALTARTLGYRMEGTVGVDAGAFGPLSFGPLLLAEGDVDVRR